MVSVGRATFVRSQGPGASFRLERVGGELEAQQRVERPSLSVFDHDGFWLALSFSAAILTASSESRDYRLNVGPPSPVLR